eukprot:51367-Rhodomonas_salina.2
MEDKDAQSQHKWWRGHGCVRLTRERMRGVLRADLEEMSVSTSRFTRALSTCGGGRKSSVPDMGKGVRRERSTGGEGGDEEGRVERGEERGGEV